MSILALEKSRVFYKIVQSVYSFSEKLFEATVKARQEQADLEIAKLLYQTGDYRSESFDYILYMVKIGKVNEIFSK